MKKFFNSLLAFSMLFVSVPNIESVYAAGEPERVKFYFDDNSIDAPVFVTYTDESGTRIHERPIYSNQTITTQRGSTVTVKGISGEILYGAYAKTSSEAEDPEYTFQGQRKGADFDIELDRTNTTGRGFICLSTSQGDPEEVRFQMLGGVASVRVEANGRSQTIRDGGTMSLAPGTTIKINGVTGQYLTVRYKSSVNGVDPVYSDEAGGDVSIRTNPKNKSGNFRPKRVKRASGTEVWKCARNETSVPNNENVAPGRKSH